MAGGIGWVGRTDRFSLPQQSRWRPFRVAAVRARHVLGDCRMAVLPWITDGWLRARHDGTIRCSGP
jgi:hypothetical protein